MVVHGYRCNCIALSTYMRCGVGLRLDMDVCCKRRFLGKLDFQQHYLKWLLAVLSTLVRMWALLSGTPLVLLRLRDQALAAGSENRRWSVDGVPRRASA
jgi:hypothetical protein